MTDDKKDLQSTGTTTTTETAGGGEAMDILTPAQEKAVRMRHGLDEDGTHELSFGLGANEQALAKLANLEAFLVDKFSHTEQLEGVFDDANVDTQAKRKIIDRLNDPDN